MRLLHDKAIIYKLCDKFIFYLLALMISKLQEHRQEVAHFRRQYSRHPLKFNYSSNSRGVSKEI